MNPNLAPALPEQQAFEAQLAVQYHSFEEARQAPRELSDELIDAAIDEYADKPLAFKVGAEQVGLKGYLDKVEATATDEAIISDPNSIAAVYLETTDMVARNLKIKVAGGTPPERIQEIAGAKQAYTAGLRQEALQTADQIVAWAEAGDPRAVPAPNESFAYGGFEVPDGNGDTVDAFDMSKKTADFHPNLKVQRQLGMNFIYGYSDARVGQRMQGSAEAITERIYLNPDAMAAPHVFEQVLQAVNKAGIPIEMKMLQRAQEMGYAHIEKARDASKGDALRGDGIVLYASKETANDVLALALAVAQDNPEAFAGRETSRVPQAVAEGVAVGSEPLQKPGEKKESLTSHRAKVLSIISQKVADSGKTGQEAREAFRRGIDYYAAREGVDPHNLAFNAVAA